jgi:tetratricopeptide (TPR) repeat protein
MSTFSSRRPGDTTSAGGRAVPQRGNIHLAGAAGSSLGESGGWPRAVPDLPAESIDDGGWDDRVAREVRHQEVIEASFDRAEAYARLGDFERALEWLDRAAALSGGLPAGYRARRARWARVATPRAQPAAGDWRNRLARSGQSGAGR